MFKLYYRLREKVTPRREGEALLWGRGQRVIFKLKNHQSPFAPILERLGQQWLDEKQLLELWPGSDPAGQATFQFFLLKALQAGLLRTRYHYQDRPLAIVSPALAGSTPPPAGDRPLTLSRFAYARRQEAQLVLASPLTRHTVILEPAAWPLVAGWAAGCAMHEAEQTAAAAGLPRGAAGQLARILAAARLLVGDPERETRHPRLAYWQFHDLLFHARSLWRLLDHDPPDSYRLRGVLKPPPVTKTVSGEAIPLRPPTGRHAQALARPLAEVLEQRASRRRAGEDPLEREELEALLHAAARVKRIKELPDEGEVSFRPAPSGGARHPLEIYPLVRRCRGLEPGLYHYDPQGHALEPVATSGQAGLDLLEVNPFTSLEHPPPQVQFLISARLGRTAWKYESIAYRLVQQDLGCLYQTLYLVATALGLAPCCFGSADVELFAQATDIDPLEEPLVGGFAVSKQ